MLTEIKKDTFNDAAFRLFAREAKARENVNEWWAYILNLTRGNIEWIQEVVTGGGLKFNDLVKLHRDLRKEVIC